MITILSAQAFRNLCDAVDDKRVSVESCLSTEAAKESEGLARWMRELLSADPKRDTIELQRMRIRSLTRAAEVMKRRAPAVWTSYEASI